MTGASEPVSVHEGSSLSTLLFLLVTDKDDLEQLVQKWNDPFMEHGLGLNLNKTELLTTDPMKQAQSLSAAVICPELNDLNNSGQCYQPMAQRLQEKKML